MAKWWKNLLRRLQVFYFFYLGGDYFSICRCKFHKAVCVLKICSLYYMEVMLSKKKRGGDK